jgi:hypothetical protein
LASLSWYQATMWDLRPIFPSIHVYYLKIFAGFFGTGARSLMRGWIYNLLVQLLLGLASTVALGSKSRRTWDHILLSHLKLSSLPVTSYNSQGYSGGILTRLPVDATEYSSQTYLTTYCQSASPSWCQASLWDPQPVSLSLPWQLSWHLKILQYGAPSLTRGWVSILFWLSVCYKCSDDN